MELMKTELQEEREKRDLAIYTEYNEMISVGHSKTRVNQHLMKKHGLHSPGTIYAILARVEKKLTQEA